MTSRQLIAPVQESIVVAAVGPIVAARWVGADERVILASLADRSERVVKLVHPDAVAAISDLYRALPDHHGIVPLLGGGVVGEFGYLVHPVQPRTLADLIARTSLAGADAAALLRPVASALSMLHDAGWVHGDVKPANVLITADGRCLLADLDDCMRIGATAARVTPFFSAPEAIAGQPLTREADHFGFAQLLAVVLGGEAMVQASRVDPRMAAIADAIRLDTAGNPSRRVLRPLDLLAVVVNGAPPTTGSSALAAAFSGLPVAGPGPDDGGLAAAVRAVFGDVDLRAPTVERLSLQAATATEPDAEDVPTSVWRTPAMLAALATAVVLVLVALVFVLTGVL